LRHERITESILTNREKALPLGISGIFEHERFPNRDSTVEGLDCFIGFA
jgi:hypothetical protein